MRVLTRRLAVAATTMIVVACGGGAETAPTETAVTTVPATEAPSTTEPVAAITAGPSADVRVLATAGSDVLLGVVQAPDGGLWLSGHTDGVALAGGASAGLLDALVVRYDPAATDGLAGSLQFGTAEADALLGISASVDGGAVVVGYSKGQFAAPNAGINDIIAASFAPDGSERWRTQLGGPDWDRGYSVVQAGGGAVYVGGYTFGGVAENFGGAGAGGHDAVVARVSSAGVVEWVVSVGSPDVDWGQSMAVDGEGGIVMVGYTQGAWGSDNAGGRDAFVTRLTPTGDVDWTVQLGSELDDWLQGVTVLSDGTIVGVGFTAGAIGEALGGTDILVVRLSADGEIQSTTQMGTSGDDRAFGAVELPSGQLAISGTVSGDFGVDDTWSGKKDAFVALLGTDDRPVWVTQFGSDADDDGYGLALAEGSLWFVGVTAGAIGDAPLAGATDAWVARIDLP